MSVMGRSMLWMHVALLAAAALIALPGISDVWLSNMGRVAASGAYLAPMSAQARAGLVEKAHDRLIKARACVPPADPQAPNHALTGLETLDACFALNDDDPLYVLTDQLDLPAPHLDLGGLSKVNRVTGDTVSLFANGYVEARVFLPSDGASSIIAEITARRTGPPPAELVVTVDGSPVGHTLLWEDGWQTAVVPFRLTPGFHRVRVEFVNDLVDPVTRADRNAYLRHIRFQVK